MGSNRIDRARVKSARSRLQRWAASFVLLLAACLPVPAQAWGQIYEYVDDQGTVHFSDVPFGSDFLPARSRSGRSGGSGRSVVASRRSGASAQRATPPENYGYDETIARVCRRYRVQPALVKAVIAAESNFNPEAVSHKGAQGLMQLMPRTAARMGVEDPMHPEDNVDGGVRYLRAMLDRYPVLGHALAAYNAGPTAVDRYRGIPPYPETKAYVKRVLNYYRGYHGDFWRASR